MVRPDGSNRVVWAEAGELLKDENGKPCLLSGIVQDITERKKAEEEIKQKNLELAELNASKDKFFSIIAHDLKSPLSGFLGLTKLMADDTSDFTLKEFYEISRNMQITAGNLYRLLENLLEWSTVQRGLIEFKPVKCELITNVKQILDVHSEQIKQKQIEIHNWIPENTFVFADVQMLNTILRNLISNAIKFTPRGGRIEIGTSIDSSEDKIEIFVKDNGIGMDKPTLDKLFKIDRIIMRPGTEKEPSTGLGLLLCKEFIDKHNCSIWVESAVGIGSTFYFTLQKTENIKL